jgi:DNA-directed RNA polymerase subunit RPC12/RpoP
VSLQALHQGSPSPDAPAILPVDLDAGTDGTNIRCPHCDWKPEKSSRWTCVSMRKPEFFTRGCGTTWNTFETRGRCPGCGHQWHWTKCLRCHTWSAHDEWYARDVRPR